MEEMLITEPGRPASFIRRQTLFVASHVPFRFVARTMSHSSSGNSTGKRTNPGARIRERIEAPVIFGKGRREDTPNPGVVHQSIDAAEAVPGLLHGPIDCTAIGGQVELHAGGFGRLRFPRHRHHHPVDLFAERLESVEPAGGGDDGAAGSGEIEADLPANPGGSPGHHHYFPLQLSPWLTQRPLRRHEDAPIKVFRFLYIKPFERKALSSSVVESKINIWIRLGDGPHLRRANTWKNAREMDYGAESDR